MSPQQLEKRKRVMHRSMALGHCVCDVRQACPCEQFRLENVCHCAGEQTPAVDGAVRLTEHVSNAGCASKISKGILKQVLAGLPELSDPRVLVGASAGDDAGVMMLQPDIATILTIDVFTPSVDDPYTFGQIAAANSLSDIYAMGGTPQAALSIVGFPIRTLPASAMHEILRGGIDKLGEAGVPVVGGHSINDAEPKCGFAVIGTSSANGFIRNAGAQVGDAIVLTKPLGTGIVSFAHQLGRADEQSLQEVAQSMMALNKLASELMLRHGAHAATDVTGFSLMGHLAEIVKNSGVEAALNFDRIPTFGIVSMLARQDVLPGAVERNRESVDEAMLDLDELAEAQQAILFGPETSGGLLVLLPPDRAELFVRQLRDGGVAGASVIGHVERACQGGRITLTTARAHEYGPVTRVGGNGQAKAAPAVESCCAGGSDPMADQESKTDTEISTAQAPVARSASADSLPAPAGADDFKAYMASVGAAGALGTKQKKLISLALSVMSRCEPCVRINARGAREAGATDEELAEAVSQGIAFGGAPVAMFYSTIRRT